jgi:hypothetical protein
MERFLWDYCAGTIVMFYILKTENEFFNNKLSIFWSNGMHKVRKILELKLMEIPYMEEKCAWMMKTKGSR